MLNVLGYSALLIKGIKKIWPLFFYLFTLAFTEVITLLIRYNNLLIMGEESNAPFYHFSLFSDLILFFYFFYSAMEKDSYKRISSFVFYVSLALTTCCYIFFEINIFEHNAWIPFISKTGIIILCVIYFTSLLNANKGFPFIAIGVFIVSNAAIINMASFPFYLGVDPSVRVLRNTIYLFPLIIMQLLFMFEAYLFFKGKKKELHQA